MPDPRIQRTHAHVLDIARRMLTEGDSEPLTFTSLAREARVSRRTLYVHWGTIERVLSEATIRTLDDAGEPWGDSAVDNLKRFLTALRDGIAEPVSKAAVTSLLSLAIHDESAAASLADMSAERMTQFRSVVGPITDDQYALLVGPIYFVQFITRKPMSDAALGTLVEQGLSTLDLQSPQESAPAA